MAGRRKRRGPGGRPPKPAAERHSERVLVSFTPAERAALEAAVGEEPVATYLRKLVLRHLGTRAKGGRT